MGLLFFSPKCNISPCPNFGVHYTLEVIERFKDGTTKIVSEPDNGIYDALNKGIRLASGDIIGLLHGDDFYANDKVLETVVNVFEKQNVDSCYGDLQYVDKEKLKKVIRHWQSSEYIPGKFKCGWMPPHPTFFVKRKIYEKYGFFVIILWDRFSNLKFFHSFPFLKGRMGR